VDVKKIPLTRDQFAIVDDADFEHLNQFKWCAVKMQTGFRAARNEPRVRGQKRKLILMSRYLLDAAVGQYVDHRNGNPLDNQRDNLRICSNAENARNSRRHSKANPDSTFKGVTWAKTSKRWRALHNHKILGYFDVETDAARAVDVAAKAAYGQFARLNFNE